MHYADSEYIWFAGSTVRSFGETEPGKRCDSGGGGGGGGGQTDTALFISIFPFPLTNVSLMSKKKKKRAVEMSYLRGACGLNRMDSESNESVCGKFGMPF